MDDEAAAKGEAADAEIGVVGVEGGRRGGRKVTVFVGVVVARTDRGREGVDGGEEAAAAGRDDGGAEEENGS